MKLLVFAIYIWYDDLLNACTPSSCLHSTNGWMYKLHANHQETDSDGDRQKFSHGRLAVVVGTLCQCPTEYCSNLSFVIHLSNLNSLRPLHLHCMSTMILGQC